MTDDIVERLRDCYERRALPTWADIREAAAEIERLRGERDTLRDKLRAFGIEEGVT